MCSCLGQAWTPAKTCGFDTQSLTLANLYCRGSLAETKKKMMSDCKEVKP